jgi:peptidoglycan/LPS O-acetylase OafA/YrhL
MARVVVDDAGVSPTGVASPRPLLGTPRDVGGYVPRRERRREPQAEPPPSTAPAATLRYRPALDGLRALAVVAVMAEHAGLRIPGRAEPVLPGGFLGVDVFLVISGFLITSLLLVEHRRSGRVDLRAFWLRRARRLLPAVAVMMAGTSVLIAVADLPLDPAMARGDALAALGYVANWRFVLTDQSYFASFGLPSPFRHLWSLSLEEQWYLVFPPLLVGAYAVVRRRPGVLLAGLLAAAAASAAWMAACYQPGQDPSRAYYGTDTRAHTLLVGAALAVVMVRFPGHVRRLGNVVPVLAGAGLVALGVLFHTVDGQQASLYRGGFAIVAVASAAAVAGVALPGASGPVHRLLSLPPIVVVGRMSYGLYLWHWPLYVWLTPDWVGLAGGRLTAVRFAAAFVAAGLSYVLVEQPIRRHGLADLCARARRAGLPGVRPALVTAVACAAVVAVVVVSTGGTGPQSVLASASATTSTTVRAVATPVTTTVVAPTHPLPAVPADRDLRVMVGGDSVAWSLGYPIIDRDIVPPGVTMKLVADLGCTITPGVALVDGVEQHARRCADWRTPWRTIAFDLQPDVVVALWGPWEVYDHRDGERLLRAGTDEFGDAYQQALAASIDDTIAVAPDARFAYLTVPCMDEQTPWLGGADSPRNDPVGLAWINDLTAEVVARYGDRATVVDLGPLVCPGGRLVTELDGVTTRRDGVHFTAEFAPTVWAYIHERIRPWLARPGLATAPGGAPPG